MKIVVIWMRFGAYHLARLREFSANASTVGHFVIGLEVASKDHYSWEETLGDVGFTRLTLFPDHAYQDLSPKAIREAVRLILDQEQPNVVAVNGWSVPEARAAMSWSRRHGVKIVLMSETKSDDRHAVRVWWKEWAKSMLARRCDSALVGGRKQAEYLASLGFPQERIMLGYDVVDNAYFNAGSAEARRDCLSLRAALNLPHLYFFASTRFLPRKNIDGLLRAYAAYRSTCFSAGVHAPWGLVIAGSGEEEASLHALVSELKIDDVHFAGFVQYDQLPIYFGLASAFVHPAKAEAWGLVVNEAAACGLPLLVGRTVGAGYELVRDGENGWRFDAESDSEITRALLAVSVLPEPDRLAMGARSRQIVANWGPERFAQGMLAAVEMAVRS